MEILAIDIGADTEDILLFDSQKKNIENCIKLVLALPTQTFAMKARVATRHCKDICRGRQYNRRRRIHISLESKRWKGASSCDD
jgi:hypothetical protein